MAQVINPVQTTMFSFATDPNLAACRPQTPPYTPSRSKIRFERADSPAPSIHPTETISPEKPPPFKSAEAKDSVFVRELDESEVAVVSEADLVYPKDMEDESDRAGYSDTDGGKREEVEDDVASDFDVSTPESGISRRLARMHCDDEAEDAKMQRLRRRRRNGKRAGQRAWKRSHSTSIDSDSEVTDLDAMDDHDLSRSARRLRRKVEEELHEDEGMETPLAKTSSYMSDFYGSPSARAGKRSATQPGHGTARHKPPRDNSINDDNDDDDMDVSG